MIGYTDDSGLPEDNLEMSQRMADNVAAELRRQLQGVDVPIVVDAKHRATPMKWQSVECLTAWCALLFCAMSLRTAVNLCPCSVALCERDYAIQPVE